MDIKSSESIKESNNKENNENTETIYFSLDEESKIELYLEKGFIKNLLYKNYCNSGNALNLILKTNLSKYSITKFEDDKTILDKNKIYSSNKNEITKILLSINNNLSKFENIDNLSISSGNSDIGINDNEFFIALANIYLNKRPKNIIVKFMLSFSRVYRKNYFETNRPTYKEFIKKLEINESDNNILFIIPITCLEHYSLMLVYNYKIYLLDYGLVHSSDDEYLNISYKSETLNKKLNDLNFSQFNELDIIIDNLLKDSELNLEEEINSLIKEQSGEIIEIIQQFIESEIKLSKKSILNEKKCYGDYNTFHNENLCKMINSLNNFSLQGSQTCSYYCMASMILIVKNEYNIQDIIDLTHKGIFQILIIKILLEEMFSNKQNVFIINNNELNTEYEIFKSKEYIIGIRKAIDYIYINLDNKILKFKPEIILDIDNIKKMLISKGFYIMNK